MSDKFLRFIPYYSFYDSSGTAIYSPTMIGKNVIRISETWFKEVAALFYQGHLIDMIRDLSILINESNITTQLINSDRGISNNEI